MLHSFYTESLCYNLLVIIHNVLLKCIQSYIKSTMAAVKKNNTLVVWSCWSTTWQVFCDLLFHPSMAMVIISPTYIDSIPWHYGWSSPKLHGCPFEQSPCVCGGCVVGTDFKTSSNKINNVETCIHTHQGWAVHVLNFLWQTTFVLHST